MYYLQSRYYNPQFCRFISADQYNYINTVDYAGTNAYAYCNNNPISYEDPNGTVAEILAPAYAIFCFLFFGIIFLAYIVQLIDEALHGTTIPTPDISISTPETIILNTAEKADSEIRAKIKNNNKASYWKETRTDINGISYVTIGNSIDEKSAISRVKNGKDVFVVSKNKAKNLAKKAGNGSATGPEIHNIDNNGNKKAEYYYYHYHSLPKTGSHIFYLN